MQKITLGSGSFIRKQMLTELGLIFDVHPAEVDEAALKEKFRTYAVEKLACALAHAKAQALSSVIAEGFIIAADQIAEVEGEYLNKAETLDDASCTLRKLSGKTHRLVTATCIYDGVQCLWSDVDSAFLTMRALTESEIEAYIRLDNPLGSVGAYYYEQNGWSLFEHIDGFKDIILGMHGKQIQNFLKKIS